MAEVARSVRLLRITTALLAGIHVSSAHANCTLSPQLQLQVNDPAFANVKTSVVVRMKVADTDPAKAHVDVLVEQATTVMERRKLVYNALRYESDTVQNRPVCGGVSIRHALADAVAAGTATEVVPLWLEDAITTRATPTVIQQMCGRPDVKDIM